MKSLLITASFIAIFRMALGLKLGQLCEEGEFACANGNCIADAYVCDWWNDCGDKSDEPEGCPTCPVGHWQCKNGNCIPGSWICDGDNDCGDGSDETEICPPCPIDHWQCVNGRCINPKYICDGGNDCGDWSDETEDACSIRAASTYANNEGFKVNENRRKFEDMVNRNI